MFSMIQRWGQRSNDLIPITDFTSATYSMCVCVRWDRKWVWTDLPLLWMCVSCRFIIQAAESHTEAAESPFIRTIFSKMEGSEIGKGKQYWFKIFTISNSASSEMHQDNFSQFFKQNTEMMWDLAHQCILGHFVHYRRELGLHGKNVFEMGAYVK